MSYDTVMVISILVLKLNGDGNVKVLFQVFVLNFTMSTGFFIKLHVTVRKRTYYNNRKVLHDVGGNLFDVLFIQI